MNIPQQIELVSIDDLTPYAANARTHSDDQITQLMAAIDQFGWTNPVLINAAGGIIAGHGRVLAAEQLGMVEVPCVRLTHLSPDQERALVIADNKLALNSGWDEDLLRQELEALQSIEFDMPSMGFDAKELERLFAAPEPDAGGGSKSGSMAAEFLIPPFTVLNAREGWWQDRKRQWIGLGIQSEVGRGENLIKRSLHERLSMVIPGQYQAASDFIKAGREEGLDDDAIWAKAVELHGAPKEFDAIPGGAGKNSAYRKGGAKIDGSNRLPAGRNLSQSMADGVGTSREETGESVYLKGSLNLEITTDPYRARQKNGKRRGATFGQDFLEGEGKNVGLSHLRQSTGAKENPGAIHPGGAGGPNSGYNRGRKVDTRATSTQDWVAGKIAEGEIEGGMAAGQTGTSIFDPVLCELAYRWFSPKGGVVLDPFAGGSVRGIVCAALGRRYVGIDLRQEQIEANRAQWPAVAARLSVAPAEGPEVPPVREETIEGIRVVRDDGVLGGTKRRALDALLGSIDADEFVYATPAYGFGQIALAYAARAAGKRATIVVAARKERHPRTQLAAAAGANIIEVDAGRLNVIQARARQHCADTGAYLIPFGMDDDMFVEAIADVARALPGDPPAEVWCVSGSGTLTRALQRAWPDAKHHAIQIGRDPDVGAAQLWKAPEKFEDDATDPPPFPSCSNYDAKAWRFIREHASEGALFWNLGADPEPAGELTAQIEPEWHCGDSLKTIPDLEVEADMIFSCPPYGDLEVYSDDPDDISTLAQAEFDAAYAKIIAAAVAKLRDDRFACFVVGDYRDKRGIYANFVSKTIAAFEAAGAGL